MEETEGAMTTAEIKDLKECSKMFDFSGFLPEEDRRLIAEVCRLKAERDALLDLAHEWLTFASIDEALSRARIAPSQSPVKDSTL